MGQASPFQSNGPDVSLQITSDADLNVDLSRGPLEALQNIFPDTNFFASQNIYDTPSTQSNVSATNTVPPPSLPIAPSYNAAMNNPLMNPEPLPEAPALSWDEWDQVMRDFQMDVENEDSQPAKGTNVTEWFV